MQPNQALPAKNSGADKLTAGDLRMNHATRDTKFIVCSLQNS